MGATDWTSELTALIEAERFSGVVRVERAGRRLFEAASGQADRAEQRPNRPTTRFATASATKGFTALAAVSLIESGLLSFETPLVELSGDDLPLVDPAVTIEHLLAHTSGVGDYLDEEELGDIDDHVLGVSAHLLEGPDDYLPLLNRHAQVSAPGARFAYNNSGYLMLAVAVERAGGLPYHRLVKERVFDRAGMATAGFLRSDALPADTAIGYLESGRTNVFHLPVIGTGDGGAYCTLDDLSRFWAALMGGEIVGRALVERMITARNSVSNGNHHYGLGFWLGSDRRTVALEGMDAGVSFRSSYQPATGLSYTILANTSSGAWPLVKILDRQVMDLA